MTHRTVCREQRVPFWPVRSGWRNVWRTSSAIPRPGRHSTVPHRRPTTWVCSPNNTTRSAIGCGQISHKVLLICPMSRRRCRCGSLQSAGVGEMHPRCQSTATRLGCERGGEHRIVVRHSRLDAGKQTVMSQVSARSEYGLGLPCAASSCPTSCGGGISTGGSGGVSPGGCGTSGGLSGGMPRGGCSGGASGGYPGGISGSPLLPMSVSQKTAAVSLRLSKPVLQTRPI